MRYKHWTPQEIEFVKKRYPHVSSKEIGEFLGRSVHAIAKKASILKLKKTDEFLYNQGKKLKPYSEVYKFKKGQKPHNLSKVGDIATRTDSDGRSYKYIKISDSNWESLQRYNWEKANGPVPKGSLIIFKDNNSLNADIGNLKCVSREENMLRNSKYNYPIEIIPSMLLINKIKTKIEKYDNGK